MHRIDNSTAVAVMPARKPAGTAGYFTQGNQTTGQLATIVEADILNAVMMEIANVITLAGIALSKTNDQQLSQAINQLINAARLGFTPVQQGGGSGQGTNKVYMGYGTSGGGVRVTVDATDFGRLAFQDQSNSFAGDQNFNARVLAQGDVVSQNRLRAAVGAYGSGDTNAGCILSDFAFSNFGAGNTYCRAPSGHIIQMGFVSAPWAGAQTSSVWNLPVAFPNLFINCLANITGYGGGFPIAGISVSCGIVNNSQIGLEVDTTVPHISPFGCSYIAWGY